MSSSSISLKKESVPHSRDALEKSPSSGAFRYQGTGFEATAAVDVLLTHLDNEDLVAVPLLFLDPSHDRLNHIQGFVERKFTEKLSDLARRHSAMELRFERAS